METIQYVHKGLNQDFDEHLQGKDTYRDALNGYLVNDSQGNFSFTTADGNDLSFTLDPSLVGHIVIGWAESLSSLYIFSTNDETELGGEGAISKVDINLETGKPNVQPGLAEIVYLNDKLNFTTKHIIGKEALIVLESSFVERLYWTDNFNNLRVLNIADQNVGNIDVSLLDIVPDKITGSINLYKQVLGGELVSGVYRYTYRLKSSDAGVQTSWSSLSIPISVIPNSIGTDEISYHNFQGGSKDEPSEKSVIIEISNIDIIYDEIEVAYFLDNGEDVDPQGKIFYKSGITGNSMLITHSVNDDFGIVTATDLLVTEARIDTVKTIATNRNRLVIGNITESENIDLSDVASGITISTFIKKTTSPTTNTSTSAFPVNNTGFQDDKTFGAGAAIDNQSVASGNILPSGEYKVEGGDIEYPAGSGQIRTDGTYFVADVTNPTYNVFSGNPQVYPYIRIQKFGALNDPDDSKYHNIRIRDDYHDHKGVAASGYYKGHWRKETYRYAILGVDTKGRPSFAYHIADKLMPSHSGQTDRPGAIETASIYEFDASRQLGVVFDNIDLTPLLAKYGISSEPERLPEFISGFQIVRAERDEGVIAQGMLWPTEEVKNIASTSFADNVGLDSNTTLPMSSDAFMQTEEPGNNIVEYERKQGTYLLHSPDHLFNYKDRFNPTTTGQPVKGLELEILDYKYGSGFTFASSTPNSGSVLSRRWNYYTDYTGSIAPPGGAAAIGARAPIYNQFTVGVGDLNVVGWNFRRSLDVFSNKSIGSSILNDDVLLEGRGAKALLLNIENTETRTTGFGDMALNRRVFIPMVNMKKQGHVPYGGTGQQSIAETKYISTGHFQPIDAATYALNGNSWVFNNVEVWGGDCFVNLFSLGRIIPQNFQFDDPDSPDVGIGHGITFPCESNVNTAYRQGRNINKDNLYGTGNTYPNGVCFNNPTQLEDFIYNEAYSHKANNVFYPAVPLNFIPKKEFINRTRHSLVKISNDPIDAFRQFLEENFLDVDINDGGINNLEIKNDNLFYWQEHSFGYIPINERAIVSDALGAPIQLGVGGVLTRYDKRNDFHGNQHQHGLIETPEGFVWIDRNNRAIITANVASQPIEVSSVKGMLSFIDEIVKKVEGDNPVDGIGINGSYCSRTKNTYITFKFFGTESISSDTEESQDLGVEEGPTIASVRAGKTLSFNHLRQEFIAFHSFVPSMYIRFRDYMFTVDHKAPSVTPNLGINKGDVFSSADGSNYVCILGHISSGVDPENETNRWAKSSSPNEIFVHDEGDLATFYRVVYDMFLSFVVNPEINIAKVFDVVEIINGDNPFSRIEYSTTDQFAADDDILNNREYEFRNKAWVGTVATDQDSRMRDYFMIVKMIKDNKNQGNPIAGSNEKIKLLSLKTIYRNTF